MKQQNKEKGKIDESLGFRQVKNSYSDVDDYISTYEPLLFEEIKAEIVSKQNESMLVFSFLLWISATQFKVLMVFCCCCCCCCSRSSQEKLCEPVQRR